MGLFDMFGGKDKHEKHRTEQAADTGRSSEISSEAIQQLATEQFKIIIAKMSSYMDIDIACLELPSIRMVSDASVSALNRSGVLSSIIENMPDTGYVAPGPRPLLPTDDLSWYSCSEKTIYLARSHVTNGYVCGELVARWLRDCLAPADPQSLPRQAMINQQCFFGYVGRTLAEQACRGDMPELFGADAKRYAPR